MWSAVGNFFKLILGRGAGGAATTTALARNAPQASKFFSALKGGGDALWGGTKDLVSGILTVGTAAGVGQLAEAGWNAVAPGEDYDTKLVTQVTGYLGDIVHGALDFMGMSQSQPLTEQEAVKAGFASLEEADEAIQQLMPIFTYLQGILGAKPSPQQGSPARREIDPYAGSGVTDQYPTRPTIPQMDGQAMMIAQMQGIAARALIQKLRTEGVFLSVYYSMQLLSGGITMPTRSASGQTYNVPVTVEAFMLEAANKIAGVG